MKFKCPSCDQPFAQEDINIQTDLALCKSCNHLVRVSELIDADFDATALRNPPKGAWYRQEMNGAVIGATTRNASAFIMVPFMCAWSEGSLGGIYGMQIKSGHFSLMLSLFGLPFLAGTFFLASVALMAICGKIEVRLHDRHGVVFEGVGRLGRKRAFNLDEVDTITEGAGTAGHPGRQSGGIMLQGRTRLRFGGNLNEERRRFVLNALRSVKAGKA